jgi:hypothetical protein
MQNIIRLGSRSECPIMQQLGLFDARGKEKIRYSVHHLTAKGDMQRSFLALRLAFFQSKVVDINGTESIRNCNLARLSYIMSQVSGGSGTSLIDGIVQR